MIAHACWIGMISSCYCSQLDTQKMIQNAMSLQTLLGINLRTLRSPPLACSFPIERTNCFVHTHTHTRIYLHAYMEAYMHASIHCYIDIYLHTFINAYIHPHLHTCLHAYVHTSHTRTYTCFLHAYMQTCRHSYCMC